MRISSLIIRTAILAVAAGVIIPLTTLAQTFAANTGTNPVISTAPLAEATKITVPSHHRSGNDQLMYGRVRDGVYTVDGMVAKLQLNYDVDAANYLYMFVPGLGTAVLSTVAEPDAITTQATLHENELTFTSGDHHFKLTGVALVNDKGAALQHLYVKLDRSAWQLNRQPMLGYGKVAQTPYEWPGALPAATTAKTEQSYVVPPVPAVLLPSTRALSPVGAPVASVGPVAPQPVTLKPVALH